MFKEYLEYAWEVSEGRFSPTVYENNHHASTWYLKSRLETYAKDNIPDARLNEDLPFADITALEGDSYIGLILTDDQRYFQTTSTKEAHVYLPKLLGEKNWYHVNFFSREYWQNPDKVYEALVHFINLHRLD